MVCDATHIDLFKQQQGQREHHSIDRGVNSKLLADDKIRRDQQGNIDQHRQIGHLEAQQVLNHRRDAGYAGGSKLIWENEHAVAKGQHHRRHNNNADVLHPRKPVQSNRLLRENNQHIYYMIRRKCQPLFSFFLPASSEFCSMRRRSSTRFRSAAEHASTALVFRSAQKALCRLAEGFAACRTPPVSFRGAKRRGNLMRNVSNSPKLVEVSKQFCEIATGARHPRNDSLGTFLTV